MTNKRSKFKCQTVYIYILISSLILSLISVVSNLKKQVQHLLFYTIILTKKFIFDIVP